MPRNHFRRQYRPFRTLRQLEGPHDFLVPGENRGKSLGAGGLWFVAIDVDADGPRVPTRNSLQKIGELSVRQRPIKVGDVVLGPADQKYPGARLMTGPRDPQRIIDQELERLQPAMAAGEDNRCDDQVRTDDRLEGRAAQQPQNAAALQAEGELRARWRHCSPPLSGAPLVAPVKATARAGVQECRLTTG